MKEGLLQILHENAVREPAKRSHLEANIEISQRIVDVFTRRAVDQGISPGDFSHLPKVWDPSSYFIIPEEFMSNEGGMDDEGDVYIREDSIDKLPVNIHESLHRAAQLKLLENDGNEQITRPFLPIMIAKEVVTEWVARMADGVVLEDGIVVSLREDQLGYPDYIPLAEIFYTLSKEDKLRIDALFIHCALTGDYSGLMSLIAENEDLKAVFYSSLPISESIPA